MAMHIVLLSTAVSVLDVRQSQPAYKVPIKSYPFCIENSENTTELLHRVLTFLNETGVKPYHAHINIQ